MAKSHISASLAVCALSLLVAVADGQESAANDDQVSTHDSLPNELFGIWNEVAVDWHEKPGYKPSYLWQFFETEVHLVKPPIFWIDGKPPHIRTIYKYRFDPTKDPKHLDLMKESDKPRWTWRYECLYSVDGDKLTVALPFGEPQKDAKTKTTITARPEGFKSGPGLPCKVVTLKRVPEGKLPGMSIDLDELKKARGGKDYYFSTGPPLPEKTPPENIESQP